MQVPAIGLNIIFDSTQQVTSCERSRWAPVLTPFEQRVRMIEFYKPQTFSVDYCGAPCCGPKALPTFPSVYHQFGPTIPGQYKDEEQAYHLCYPGVKLFFVYSRIVFDNVMLTVPGYIHIPYPTALRPHVSH